MSFRELRAERSGNTLTLPTAEDFERAERRLARFGAKWAQYSGTRWYVEFGPGAARLMRRSLAAENASDERGWEAKEAARVRGIAGYDARVSGRRGTISGWSRESRTRMSYVLKLLDYGPLFEDNGIPALVTLTMPTDWERITPTPKLFKDRVNLLFERFFWAWGRRAAGVWKVEFQRRGAPHLHMLMTPPIGRTAAGESWETWLARSWAELCAPPPVEVGVWARAAEWSGIAQLEALVEPVPVDRERRRLHRMHGTSTDYSKGLQDRSPAGIAIYFSKHGLFGAKDYQNQPPPLWRDGFKRGEGGIRYWGYPGLLKARARIALNPVRASGNSRYVSSAECGESRPRSHRSPGPTWFTGRVSIESAGDAPEPAPGVAAAPAPGGEPLPQSTGTPIPSDISLRPRRRSRAGLGWIIALAVLLVLALAGGGYLAYQLVMTRAALDDANLEIEEQRQEIEEQTELIEERQTFGAAMEELMATALEFDGVPLAALVPFDEYAATASSAWQLRRSPTGLRGQTEAALAHTAALRALLDAALAQREGNTTGSLSESLVDQLGAGFVSVVFDDVRALCGGQAIGCVSGEDPYTVHLDWADYAAEYTDDWARQFIARHEFAHVLQFTNPEPTETAAAAFGGDWEFMADCYALTMLDAWTLDRRVWISSYEYWDVSYGYGQVCDAAQRQVIHDWLAQVGVRYHPISQ